LQEPFNRVDVWILGLKIGTPYAKIPFETGFDIEYRTEIPRSPFDFKHPRD